MLEIVSSFFPPFYTSNFYDYISAESLRTMLQRCFQKSNSINKTKVLLRIFRGISSWIIKLKYCNKNSNEKNTWSHSRILIIDSQIAFLIMHNKISTNRQRVDNKEIFFSSFFKFSKNSKYIFFAAVETHEIQSFKSLLKIMFSILCKISFKPPLDQQMIRRLTLICF